MEYNIGEEIRKEITVQAYSVESFAKALGWSAPTVYNLFKCRNNIRLDKLEHVCRVLRRNFIEEYGKSLGI